jgi:hypothetical protein
MTLRAVTVRHDPLAEFATRQQAEFDVGAGQIEQQVLHEGRHRTLSDVMDITGAADARVSGAFATAEGTLERQQRAGGFNISERQAASQQRRLGLSRALSTVGERDRAISADIERRDVARTAGSSLRDVLDQQGLRMMGQAEGMRGDREMEFEADKAAHSARKYSTLGTIAGIGLNFVPGGQFFAPAVSGAIASRGQ